MEFTGILKEYSGSRIPDKLPPLERELYFCCLEYMHEAFGDNVEYERLLNDQVLLCPATREALYLAPGPTKYRRGMRPALDEIVDAVTADAKCELDSAIAIVAYIRDLKEKSGGRDYFYGGTEEELIKKGERYCERVARLMVALLEVKGIAARIVFHMTGHLTVEAYVDGKWGYFDPRYGLFYLDADGRAMSVAELAERPDMIYKQEPWVYAYGSKEKTAEEMAKNNCDNYLHPDQIQIFGYYSLTDSDKFHYEWMPSYIYPVPSREAAHKRFVSAIKEYVKTTRISCSL